MGKGLFERLSLKEKIDLIYQKGIFIGKASSNGRTSLIYAVDNHVVEITYFRYRQVVADIVPYSGSPLPSNLVAADLCKN